MLFRSGTSLAHLHSVVPLHFCGSQLMVRLCCRKAAASTTVLCTWRAMVPHQLFKQILLVLSRSTGRELACLCGHMQDWFFCTETATLQHGTVQLIPATFDMRKLEEWNAESSRCGHQALFAVDSSIDQVPIFQALRGYFTSCEGIGFASTICPA